MLNSIFEEMQGKYSNSDQVKISKQSLKDAVKKICQLATKYHYATLASPCPSASRSKKNSHGKKRKEVLLSSIREEKPSDDDDSCECDGVKMPNDEVKALAKKIHKCISYMRIGSKGRGPFLKSPNQLDLILSDIDAIRTGNYDLID